MCVPGFGTLVESVIFVVFRDALLDHPGAAGAINTVTHNESRFISGNK